MAAEVSSKREKTLAALGEVFSYGTYVIARLVNR
jgi:hypothetical protein